MALDRVTRANPTPNLLNKYLFHILILREAFKMNSIFLCSLLLVIYAFVAESFRPIAINRGVSRLPHFAVADVASGVSLLFID